MRTLRLALALALLLPLAAADKQKLNDLKECAKAGASAISRIVPYLKDEDPEVRREAVRVLVSAGTQRSLEPLTAATEDSDTEVQLRATDGLVNFYLPGYVEQGLSGSIKRVSGKLTARWLDNNDAAVDPDTPIRPEISRALGTLVGSSGSTEARANAARALGVLRARDGVPALVDALKSKDTRLLYESLVALQKIRDRSAGLKAAALVRDLDEKVQIAAIETTGLLLVKDAARDLNRVLDHPASKKVRKATLIALAQIADPASRETFHAMLEDKDDDGRMAAAEYFGRLGQSADREALEKAWNAEKKTPPRLAQAFALGLLGNSDVSSTGPIGYLVNNLNSKAWRGVALPYLVEMVRQEGPRKALYARLDQTGTREERIGMAQALASSQGADAIAPLEKLSKDDDAMVSREAFRALRILKGSVK